MGIFRIQKTKGFTIMSNYHLQDTSVSLKAKGLLSQMLSLPDNWDYTIKGLAAINKEGVDAIRSTLIELEKAGYIVRKRLRNELGQVKDIEYNVYEKPQQTSCSPDGEKPTETPNHSDVEKLEQPTDKPDRKKPELENPIQADPMREKPMSENPMQVSKMQEKPMSENPIQANPMLEKPKLENPTLDNPTLDNPTLDNPILDKPMLDKPMLENPTEINTNITNILTKQNTKSINHSINQSMAERQMDMDDVILYENYKGIIKKNIEYDVLITRQNKDLADEITDIITDTVVFNKKPVSVGGNLYPAEIVKNVFLKLTLENVECVMEYLKINAAKITNLKNYIIALLYSSKSTTQHRVQNDTNYDIVNFDYYGSKAI